MTIMEYISSNPIVKETSKLKYPNISNEVNDQYFKIHNVRESETNLIAVLNTGRKIPNTKNNSYLLLTDNGIGFWDEYGSAHYYEYSEISHVTTNYDFIKTSKIGRNPYRMCIYLRNGLLHCSGIEGFELGY